MKDRSRTPSKLSELIHRQLNSYALFLISIVLGLMLATTVLAAGKGTRLSHPRRAAFRLVYSFTGGNDGNNPLGGLIIAGNGVLYGATLWGGAPCSGGCGTVFQLTPTARGGWTLHTIYSFLGTPDLANPFSHVTFDQKGDLYGTAGFQGPNQCYGHEGCGGIFRPAGAKGGWKESVILSFSAAEGEKPLAGLTLYKGSLYGATPWGPQIAINGAGHGTVFALTPGTRDHWKHYGSTPFGVLDKAGRLYGTTQNGLRLTGSGGYGTVYQITP